MRTTTLDTIRWRIILGMTGLFGGVVIAAIVAITALGTLRRSLAAEIAALRTSSEVGNGLVTAVFEEIRSAEEYLDTPSREARDQFQASADGAFRHQKQLENLTGLAEADRLTVNRIKQLQAAIDVQYSMAHALLDVGRTREAALEARAVRAPAGELTRLVRDL